MACSLVSLDNAFLAGDSAGCSANAASGPADDGGIAPGSAPAPTTNACHWAS